MMVQGVSRSIVEIREARGDDIYFVNSIFLRREISVGQFSQSFFFNIYPYYLCIKGNDICDRILDYGGSELNYRFRDISSHDQYTLSMEEYRKDKKIDTKKCVR